jgi:poly-gamma-glutamate synthesis protein (capsule biosynthesis protein)
VDGDTFAALRKLASGFNWSQQPPAWWARAYDVPYQAEPDVVYLHDKNTLGQPAHVVDDSVSRFVLGEGFQSRGRLHRADLQRNLASIAEARRMADWVLFSIHNHEGAATIDEPSSHVRELAHAVIDAGADIVVGHGPHRDRGIEIYRDRPIFYSLGNFIAQQPTMTLQPHDMLALYDLGHEHNVADLYDVHYDAKRAQSGPYWWSVVALVRFRSKRLCELSLHPIELGFGAPRWQAGRPQLASGATARQALERLRELSAAFGVPVDFDVHTGEGRVRLA